MKNSGLRTERSATAIAETPLSGGSVSRVTSAVTSRTPATASAELASRPEYFQPSLFAPECEWDGTIPVPYNVVPY